MIQIEITTKCNARCIYCYKRGLPVLNETSMPMDVFRRIVDGIPFPGKRWLLQGCGEPLMAENLCEMSDYLYQKESDSIIEIITNGSLLDAATFYRLIDHHINRISISADGIGQTYERLRPGMRWADIVQVLKTVKDYKKRCADPISIGFTAVAMKSNLFALEDFLRYISDYGIDFLSINSLINMHGRFNGELLSNIPEDTLSAFFEKLVQLGKTLGVCVMTPMTSAETTPEQRCSFCENSMYVDVDGKVDPCCMLASHGTWGSDGKVDPEKIAYFSRAWESGTYPEYCRGCINNKTAFLGK